ncbi:MAG: adenosylcobinamide-GDP ribazoletransferase [Actinomycetes bacterium]
MNGLRFAVGTLTALPVGPPHRLDAAVVRAAMLAAPLVGLGLGVVAGLVLAASVAAGVPSFVSAGLAVAALALMTRGLHLDELADTADGLAASYSREKALAVMRRGDVGPAGVVTLVLVLGLQVAALAACVQDGRGPLAVVVAVVAGRAVLPLACSTVVPAARAEGLGATVAGSVPVVAAALVALLVLLGTSAVAALAGVSAARALVAVLVGWALAALLVRRCVRRLGGVTGDVLGAAVEVAVTAVLVALSAG